MSGRHTPGPWAWDGDYTLRPVDPDPDRSAVHTILSPDGPYGFVQSVGADVDAEFQADQRLIAAAPELLDIAVRIDALLTRQHWISDSDASESALLRDARAAIAKATGGAT